MLDNIYQNSTRRPQNSIKLLHRPGLERKYEEALSHRFITVTAGAGYGKTQSTARFLEHADVKSIWLNLCELDNLLSRFWEVFSFAVFQKHEELGRRLLEAEFPESDSQFEYFIKLLAEAAGRRRLIFVFDDFHVIYEPKIFHFVLAMQEAPLDNFGMILISRNSRVFPEEYVSQVQPFKITQADLKLSREECVQLLFQNEQILDLNAAEALYEITAGWPFMIGMIAETQTGLERYVRDEEMTSFFIKQVMEQRFFNSYPEPRKQLLVQMSLLPAVPDAVMEQIAACDPGWSGELPEADMFISHTDGEYLLHDLYRDFLTEKQVLLDAQAQKMVYRIYADWSYEHDLFIESVYYYKKCGMYREIWDSIQREELDCPVEYAAYMMETIDEFPEWLRKEDPFIDVVYARLQLNNGMIEQSMERCQRILTQYQEHPWYHQIAGEVYILIGWIDMLLVDYDFVRCFKKAAQYLPDGSRFVTNKMSMNNGTTAISMADTRTGAVAQWERAVQEASPYLCRSLNGCGAGCGALAAAATGFYQMDFAKTRRYCRIAIEEGRQEQQHDVVSHAGFLLVRVAICMAHYDEMIRNMQFVSDVLLREERMKWTVMNEVIQGWIYARLGDYDKIPEWILKEGRQGLRLSPNGDEKGRFIRAYVYLEQGKYVELSAYLAYIEEIQNTHRAIVTNVELYLYQAVCYLRLEQEERAMRAFYKAYDNAHNNELLMIFSELGKYTRNLINAARKSSYNQIPHEWLDLIYAKASTYAKRLSKIRLEYSRQEQAQQAQLTARERSVLICLSQGLTRAEIAKEQELSINTVKSILKNIYNKLGAVNKADAIRIATSNKLI